VSHFFISRAGEDSDIAKWIADLLKDAGHDITLQDYDFTSGSFPEHIGRALAEADRFVAVLSPHYLEKQFTLAELHAAYARDPLHLILPVHVAACKNPDLIKHLIYIDFAGKDEAQRKRALLDAVGPSRTTPEIRTSIQKLPTADPHLFGRDAQLDWLEQAWWNLQTNFVQIIAPGGAGKTALMSRWYRRHLGNVTVFGWSFYSQGTGDKSQTSSDPFFAEALRWFGIEVAATESIWAKVDRLAAHLRRERVLLILDGVEPLQEPSGSLRDLALKSLLQELAARNAGMVLVTTRVRLIDVPDALPDEVPHSLSLDLENLSPADGARYLEHLGVRGPVDELRAASEGYENHALALTLLGTYLVTFCEADIRRRADIRELQVDETKAGRHARKVMASYARMYDGEPELDILRALGYFDRPAEPAALKLVLPAMEDRKYRAALKRLRDARLILTMDPASPLDCHPLVREHFAEEATTEGHARLYEHYKNQAPRRPGTLEEMRPLFYAVYHGCQAGGYQKALDDVYNERILRRAEFYLTKMLGAFGTDLSLLASFFATPWLQAVASLSAADQSWVIGRAGYSLRAVGRLADAVDPMRTGAEAYVKSEDWKNASVSYGNLSELHLSLGNIPGAVTAAQQAVDFADRSGDWAQRITKRTTLADALHQSGKFAEAMRLFAEAERLQAERQLEYPILYSAQGYQYCDLLLGQGQTPEVRRRASQTLLMAEQNHLLLAIGVDHVSLGRSYPAGSAEGTQHFDHAVDFLRRAGQLDYLPRALFARGTPRDLDEVFRIASRCGMRLHLADYHLAVGNLAEAERLIDETGYHRRDGELEALRRRVSSA
jgi:tetratricopeptide (TPR) repeat protein